MESLKVKTLEERIEDGKEIYQKLMDLGIHKRFDAMNPFYETLQTFIKEGCSASGKIKLPEIQRILFYQLITRKNKPCVVWLKFTGK